MKITLKNLLKMHIVRIDQWRILEQIVYRLKSWHAFNAIPALRAQMYKKMGSNVVLHSYRNSLSISYSWGIMITKMPQTGIKCVNLVKGLKSFKTNFCAFSTLKWLKSFYISVFYWYTVYFAYHLHINNADSKGN